MRKYLPVYLALFSVAAQAQTLNGTVTDAETGQPLEAVVVSVMRDNTTIDYALTDAQGRYALPWKYKDTLQVCASLLGYRREVRRIAAAGILNLSLQSEAIALKEVQIRPGRIHSRKDTVRYDLSQFASSKDVHIKDVLKRLPGVDVEENGQVKYKGKAIDHFLVEGMDVTGGRYNQVNNNLNAKAVKTAEIMENYQSLKTLKGKISSDEVALNLKLDPKARDQWIMNGMLGMGLSNAVEKEEASNENKGILWKGALNALQLGKGKQSLYSYKTNNNGTDLSKEQMRFINNDNVSFENSSFLSQPGISAPLDKKRLLFNNTHTVNGNHMCKWNDEQGLRLQAGYTHDQIEQKRSNLLSYYQPGDTIRMDETYHYRLLNDNAYAEIHYEDNNPKHYLSNRLKAEGTTERSTLQELHQRIQTSRLKADNCFHLLLNKGANTWEVNSAVQYTLLPSSLQVAGEKETYRRQSLHTDNSISYLRKHNDFTQQYRAGMQTEWGKLSHSAGRPTDISNLSVYIAPFFQLERGKWEGSLTLPFRGKRFFSRKENYLLYNPSIYLRYQIDYHWKLTFFSSLTRSAGNGTDLYRSIYRTDYRTWRNTSGTIPVSLSQNYRLYGEYKNTVQEFFITASLYYQRANRNTLYGQSVSQDSIIRTHHALPNQAEYWSFTGTLSKGFYDWHLKTSLNFSLNSNTGKQLTNKLPQTFRYDYLKVEPKIIWQPSSKLEAEYHAVIGYGGSKIGNDTRLTPLLDFVQRLHLTLSFGKLELSLSGEHYRNDLNGDTHLSTVFADASLVYKTGKWRLEANFNNLLNKKEYAYTLYSATQSSTSRLNIRPREVMITASHQF
ncbi:carboxypeptidase regulatory-like domain-containing protein [Bacteroides zoogleoformans]|uniref:carboxypeptidase regulatory-like domain-containing protein n=1 Tax=Bacteroides zoogleoformans TaxID=28119 RepID=UPI00248EC196|nr:carboxypeptidase regulatory-like domain-containing protein [Bacteroides zoogleoformans]